MNGSLHNIRTIVLDPIYGSRTEGWFNYITQRAFSLSLNKINNSYHWAFVIWFWLPKWKQQPNDYLAVHWYSSSLTHRTQLKVSDALPSPIRTDVGTPQSSISSPLLFTLVPSRFLLKDCLCWLTVMTPGCTRGTLTGSLSGVTKTLLSSILIRQGG